MGSYKIKILVLGGMSTNCYLMYQEDTKEAIIVDPAAEADVITKHIRELSLTPKAILLTHGHFDHIGAVHSIKEEYGILVYGHEAEKELLENGKYNLSSMFNGKLLIKLDEMLVDGQILKIAGFSIRVLHTPGHTAGGVCYYLEKEKLLFSGDTIFAGSVGRTDFPTGDMGVLMRSIREVVLQLPDDVEIYPGHGEQTNVGYERTHNPFA